MEWQDVLRQTEQSTRQIGLATFYMDNIAADIVAAQRAAFQYCLRDSWLTNDMDVFQVRTDIGHDHSMDKWLRAAAQHYRIVMVFDIDAFPLCADGLTWLFSHAMAGNLVGCAQRASHLQNNRHVYAGPCGLAVASDVYVRIGQPSCCGTARSDVAEELTWAAEAEGIKIDLLWPNQVLGPKLWPLRTDEPEFGIGTVYGTQQQNLIFHNFESRYRNNIDLMLSVSQRVAAGEQV